jgi:hypothetical protein
MMLTVRLTMRSMIKEEGEPYEYEGATNPG